MAREDKDKGRDEEVQQPEPEIRGKRGLVKWLIISVAALVFLGLAAGGGMYAYKQMMVEK